jgi:hypothetical protein
MAKCLAKSLAKSLGESAPTSDQQFQSEEVHRAGTEKVRADAKVVSDSETPTRGLTGMLKRAQLRRSHERKMKQARQQHVAAHAEAWASSPGLKSPT